LSSETEDFTVSLDEVKNITYDACIIGTGAGGAVVGYHLAKAGFKVLMLEKGKYYPHNVIAEETKEENLLELWKNRGAQVTKLPPIAISQGECVGGSTIINYGMCFRMPRKTFGIWEKKHNIECKWWEELEDEYTEVEKQISVNKITNAGASHVKLEKGCTAMGYDGVWMNKNYTGTGENRVKQNVLISYLQKAPREHLTICSECKAEKIVEQNDRIVEVKAASIINNETIKKTIKSKIVVLSAGAIASSEILLKSKIANYSGQVGKHLSLHPASSVIGIFDEKINGQNDLSMAYTCDHFGIEKTGKTGFMVESVFLSLAQFSSATPGTGDVNKEFLKDYNKSAIAGVLIQDEPNGTISLNWSKEAIIDYKLSKSDEEKLVEGLKQTALMFFKAGAKKVITGNIAKTVLTSPFDLWKIEQKGLGGVTYRMASAHPQGGNRMGGDKETSVVNSYCKSHKIDNLYICDASVFPTSLGVNPQLTVMAIASLAAKKIIKEKDKVFGP